MNRSVLLVLDERRVLIHVIVVAINDCARVEPGRAVLELQAHADELGLDLVDRLGTEVADVEQVGLAAPDELTHGVDALALEAVVGPDGQVEVLDGQSKIGGKRRVGGRGAHVDTSASTLSSRARPNSSTRVLPAEAMASRGAMESLVSTSTMSLSKSVRCSTRVASTL